MDGISLDMKCPSPAILNKVDTYPHFASTTKHQHLPLLYPLQLNHVYQNNPAHQHLNPLSLAVLRTSGDANITVKTSLSSQSIRDPTTIVHTRNSKPAPCNPICGCVFQLPTVITPPGYLLLDVTTLKQHPSGRVTTPRRTYPSFSTRLYCLRVSKCKQLHFARRCRAARMAARMAARRA